MTLLDLQTMETPKAETTDEFTGGAAAAARACCSAVTAA